MIIFSESSSTFPGSPKKNFFERLEVEPGPADPEQLPYYLLIVGDPETVPYRFQYLLDMQYAVGRLSFDTPEDYGRYADSVIRCERGESNVNSDLALFTVSHEGDDAIKRLRDGLTQPLEEVLSEIRDERRLRILERGQKSDLGQILGGSDTPAFLFTATHGLSFQSGHPKQAKHQGALLCQEWPGRGTAPRRKHYFSAMDVTDEARLLGLISFHFGCFSAGTPESTNYPSKALSNPPRHAPKPLISPLAKRLLSHPNGGALAVLGHVDRIWSLSFGSGHGKGHYHFKCFLKDILSEYPVGSAMDWLNERFAELSTELTDRLEGKFTPNGINEDGYKLDPRQMARMWRSNNDARNFILLGDPAVRLAPSRPRQKIVSMTETGYPHSATRARILPALHAQIYRRLHSRPAAELSKSAATAIRSEQRLLSEACDDAIIVDASALVELLLRTHVADLIEKEIASADLHAPHVIDIEVAQALRHYLGTRDINSDRVTSAISDLASLPITRHAYGSTLPRIIELQDTMSANEAAYIALAESLSATLLTCNPQLSLVARSRVKVKLIS